MVWYNLVGKKGNMTYKGVEVEKPTLKMIEEYCKKNYFEVPPGEIYKHYCDKKWLTKEGNPITSVEVMCNAWNGVYISRKKKKSKRKAKKVVQQILAENHAKEIYTPYKDQLDDPCWKAFRNFIFTVRGNKCEICGSKKTIQVHHPQYYPNCKAWEYTCKDVIVLCRQCHRKIHGISTN